MNRFRWRLGFTTIALLGCADLGTSPVLRPEPRGPITSESDGDPPTEWPVQIRSTTADVIMGDQYSPSYIQAQMLYDAYHASISATATLRDPSGSSAFSLGPVERHSFAAFRYNSHGAQWRLTTPHSCGTILDVNTTYSAWWIGIGSDGESRLDPKNASRFTNGVQPECAEENESGENDNDGESGPGPGTSPGGGPGDTKYCWWQYTYDAESGEIIDYWLVGCWYM